MKEHVKNKLLASGGGLSTTKKESFKRLVNEFTQKLDVIYKSDLDEIFEKVMTDSAEILEDSVKFSPKKPGLFNLVFSERSSDPERDRIMAKMEELESYIKSNFPSLGNLLAGAILKAIGGLLKNFGDLVNSTSLKEKGSNLVEEGEKISEKFNDLLELKNSVNNFFWKSTCKDEDSPAYIGQDLLSIIDG